VTPTVESEGAHPPSDAVCDESRGACLADYEKDIGIAATNARLGSRRGSRRRPRRWVVVSAGGDAVRVSDFPSLKQMRNWVTHRIWVRGVAVTLLASRHVIISPGRDSAKGGSLRVIDAFDGTPYGEPIRHDDWAASVVVTDLGRRAKVVCGMSNGTIRRWDLASRKPEGEPLSHIVESGSVLPEFLASHVGTDAVGALATAELGGAAVIISGGQDGKLRLWDLGSWTPLGDPVDAHQSGVAALATAELGRGAVIVSGGGEGPLRRWDLGSLTALGDPVDAHQSGVGALAVADVSDGPVIVSGGGEGQLRRWDLGSLTALGDPVDAHQRGVDALVVAELNWFNRSVVARVRSRASKAARAASKPIWLAIGAGAIAIAVGAVVAAALLITAQHQSPVAPSSIATSRRTAITLLYLLSFLLSVGGVIAIFVDLAGLLGRQREYRHRLAGLNPRVTLDDLRLKFFAAPDLTNPEVQAEMLRALESRVVQLEDNVSQNDMARDQIVQEIEEQGRQMDDSMNNLQLLTELTGVDRMPVVALVGAALVAAGLIFGLVASLVWLYS
jgi:hypothetical protein